MRRWIGLLAIAAAIALVSAFVISILWTPKDDLEYNAFAEDTVHATPEVATLLAAANDSVAETARSFPTDPSAVDLMAEFHLRFGKAENAERWWRRCLEIAPNYAPAHHAIATIAFNRADHAGAAASFRAAMALDPNSSIHPVQLAEALMQMGELDEAIKILESDLDVHPASMPCHAMLGLVYVQSQRDEEGKRCLEKAIEMAPDYTNAYFSLAKACARLGDRQKSDEYMAEFQRLKREDEQRHRNLLKTADDVQSVRQAVANFYVDAAKIYIAHGDVTKGEQFLLQAAELGPSNAECQLALAWLYHRQGKSELAIERLAQAATVAPDDLDAHIKLGEFFAELGQFEQAEKACLRVIEMRPKLPGGYAALSRLYVRFHQKLQAARQLAVRAAEMEPVAKNYVLLAMACQACGDIIDARAALDQAIALEPRSEELLQLRQRLGDE